MPGNRERTRHFAGGWPSRRGADSDVAPHVDNQTTGVLAGTVSPLSIKVFGNVIADDHFGIWTTGPATVHEEHDNAAAQLRPGGPQQQLVQPGYRLIAVRTRVPRAASHPADLVSSLRSLTQAMSGAGSGAMPRSYEALLGRFS